jgi:hypothetical protein
MKPLEVALKLDASEFSSFIDSSLSNLDNTILAERGPKSLFSIFQSFLKSPSKFVRFDCDCLLASGASELTVRLKPTDSFRRCVMTARTGNGNLSVIQELSHV